MYFGIYLYILAHIKYAGNPLTNRGTTIYNYISNTPPYPETHSGSTTLSLESKK
jgi:hypothetical protein